ncbi:SDR family NAD(P)-dependent oxidoreductase [Streptococcus gallolyticus]|uniref:SDR family NAD(P)-dependent oxidoreductase n=1 Tax=Streptococcus gallolyticus TaxID=315405 RepID=UPI00211C065E|nr:glucose 1-dehydrogenase [Streptococcus gallolyticus]MCQ9215922.1 glucose 1-dehydrogenase [Streptococcus gallolyticus]
MSKQFENKVAVVTGGGSGIGRAIAERYANEGAKVIIAGRRENVLKEVADNNKNISYVVADITNSDDVAKIVKTVETDFNGQLDILVNNAGWAPVTPLKELTLADYDRAFALDVRALLDMTIQTLPFILKAKGTIINLSTVGAQHRGPNMSMYLGAKAAVENFTRVWAMELAADGVRVNAIAPGTIATDIWNQTDLSEEDAKAHMDNIISMIPLRYVGASEDIANAAAYLASEQARYVTGAILAVDGGMGAS